MRTGYRPQKGFFMIGWDDKHSNTQGNLTKDFEITEGLKFLMYQKTRHPEMQWNLYDHKGLIWENKHDKA